MKPSIGRIVIYKLGQSDVDQINRRRTNSHSIAERIKEEKWPIGAQAHIGNEAHEGQEFPMVVTAVWSENTVNGQVMLDGNDTFWALSVVEGNFNNQWHWPVREE